MIYRRLLITYLISFLLSSACAQRTGEVTPGGSVAPGVNDRYATEEGRTASVGIFEAKDRALYQKPDAIIQNLALKDGDIVCEVGAGSGYFTPYLSRAVGRGRVYAEDPQREFLELLRHKIETQRLANVEVVLGTYTDTNIPDGVCDVTFVLDAYHHFEWPQPMLDAMRRDTKRGGHLVIVDFYRRQNELFDRYKIDASKHLRLDLDGVVEEITRFGWKHVETRTFLQDQYFAVFVPR
jgi:ubiquinone/menaquinone biosynthesis C-methylase UbiE